MISTQEFDKRFDNDEDISDFIDYKSSMDKKDLLNMLKNENEEKISITFTHDIKTRLEKKSQELGIGIKETIKVLLAKELGLI